MMQRRTIRTRRITWRKTSGAGRLTEAQVDDRSVIPILRKPTKELKEPQETTLPGERNKSHRTDSNR